MMKVLSDYNAWIYKNSMYINIKTNKCQYEKPDSEFIAEFPTYANNENFTLLDVDKDNNLLIYSAVIKDIDNGIVCSHFHSYKIDKDKNILQQYHYNEDNSERRKFDKSYVVVNSCSFNEDETKESYFKNVIRKVFDIEYSFEGSSVNELDEIEKLGNFLNYVEPKNKGPKQKIIAELNAFVTPLDIDSIRKDIIYRKEKMGKDVTNFTYISKVEGYKEACICLHHLCLKDNESLVEVARTYVCEKKHYFARMTNTGDFMRTNIIKSLFRGYLLNFKKSYVKNTLLKYVGESIEEVNDFYKLSLIGLMLSVPVVEKIYKGNGSPLIYTYLYWQKTKSYFLSKSIEREFKKWIENRVGKCDWSNDSIYKCLGINKYQFNYLSEYLKPGNNLVLKTKNIEYNSCCYDGCDFINKIKEILGQKDISYLSNETFDFYINSLKEFSKIRDCRNRKYPIYGYVELIRLYISIWGTESFRYKKDKLIKIIDSATSDYDESDRNYRNYRGGTPLTYCRDLLEMIQEMEMGNTIKFDFDTCMQVKQAHDELTAIYNLKKSKIEHDKFIEQVKKIKSLAYEGGKYSVVVPEKPEDVATEGITLHHCVKSYIPRICKGETSIVFIRENDNLNEPFYTMEIRGKEINQVHGFANCCVPADSDLAEFIREWAKKKKLKIPRKGYNIIQ